MKNFKAMYNSSKHCVQAIEMAPLPIGQKTEKLWREFFSDPSQWWDHRLEKTNARFPDFKHKKTQEALWIIAKLNPPWVEAQVAAMAPGTVQSNIFSWNARLTRYTKAGQYGETIKLYQQLQVEGLNPNKFTFIPVLNACGHLRAIEEGRHIHTQVLENGCSSDVYVGSTLIDMYAKCGSIEEAWRVFKNMPMRNTVSWNTMILGYVKCGQGHRALKLFQEMEKAGVEPSPFTFVGLLSACSNVLALEEGKRIHQQINQRGFECNRFVSSCLVDMYAKCGNIEDARVAFNMMPVHDVVAWSAMIQGYVNCGQGQKAVELFLQMQQEQVEPDSAALVGFFNACASVAALNEGRRVHEQIIQKGLESNVFVDSCLVDMYAKCGSIGDAWAVFTKMPTRNVVSWNAMIGGLVKCGKGKQALILSRHMHLTGVKPDSVTLVALLNACASLAALEEGRNMHRQISEGGWESDVFVGSALVDMYAKCGSLEDAQRMFNKMSNRNVVSWNAMLGGYAMHGVSKHALRLFEQMPQDIEITRITFVSLLAACSHGGLVTEGLHYFESMNSVYDVSATVEHYACMLDLLGRAGRLHEAEDLIKTMSCDPDPTVWTSLLGACRVHGNVEMGEGIVKQVLEWDPGNPTSVVLLSNIFANAGKWDKKSLMKQWWMERDVKEQVQTWIVMSNELHSFTIDDQEHPQLNEIHAELKRLLALMLERGYVPDNDLAFHYVKRGEKNCYSCYHSEKLAIAFGLISTPQGTPIHIFKNLEVCAECHSAIKYIAKIARRAIIIRDVKRFHHIEDGACSCRDYW